MISYNINISSPLGDIAKMIGKEYLLLPFPKTKLPNGLLDYQPIRQAGISKDILHRPIHGYQNACEVAVLIPILIKFYQKYCQEFDEKLQEEINAITPEQIKLLQIVGIMRSSGRTIDSDSGFKFAEQGKKECGALLKKLGVQNEETCEIFSEAIIKSEYYDKKELNFYDCILSDVTSILTIRDTLSYDKKTIYFDYFAFYQRLKTSISVEAVFDLLNIAYYAAVAIKSHQGFLLADLKYSRKNQPVHNRWPKLNTFEEYQKNKLLFLEQQRIFEYQDNCFEQCEKDISAAYELFDPNSLEKQKSLPVFQKLMEEYWQDLEVLLKNERNINLINNFYELFSGRIDSPVLHEGKIYNLTWEIIINYFVYETKKIELQFFSLESIFEDAVVTKEDSGWYFVNFVKSETALYYLNLFKMLLPSELSAEFTQAKICKDTDNGNSYYRFRLTSSQFQAELPILKKSLFREILFSRKELISQLREAINKNQEIVVSKLLKQFPSLKYFPIYDSEPPLHYCIRLNYGALVKHLVEVHNVDVNHAIEIPNSHVNGLTPLFQACRFNNVDDNLLLFLLEKGANPNIALKNGQTPIAIAAFNNCEKKVQILVESQKDLNINAIFSSGDTALTLAVKYGSRKIVDTILSIEEIDVNNKTPNVLLIADSIDEYKKDAILRHANLDVSKALELQWVDSAKIEINGTNILIKTYLQNRLNADIASWRESLADFYEENEFIRYAQNIKQLPTPLLEYNYLRSLKQTYTEKKEVIEHSTLAIRIQLARKLWSKLFIFFHQSNRSNSLTVDDFAKEVDTLLKQLGGTYSFENLREVLESSEKKPIYVIFMNLLEKINDLELLENITKDFSAFLQKYTSRIDLLPKEKEHIVARKIWIDVISETFLANANYIKENQISQKVITRIKALGYPHQAEGLYHSCIKYIKENSVIMVTFKGSYLSQEIKAYQLLNMYEKDNRCDQIYSQKRDNAEKNLFNFLSPALSKILFTNRHARPRYGSLFLMAGNAPINAASTYGNSFITFKEAVKQNALFSPTDTLNSYDAGIKIKLASFHHLELMLWQFTQEKLKALIQGVKTGIFPLNFNQAYDSNGNGYLEVLLPPLEFINPHLVEHIHINSTEYTLSQEELSVIQNLNISITNQLNTPYPDFNKKLITAIEDKNSRIETIEKLCEKIPSLLYVTNKEGQSLVCVAAKAGNLEALRFFKRKGLAFFYPTQVDNRPFNFAIFSRNLDVMKAVVNAIQEQTGKTIEQIVNIFRKNSPLHIACRLGHISIVSFLLENGAQIDAQNEHGCTAIHIAVKHKFLDIVDLLLESGANINILDNFHKKAYELDIYKVHDYFKENYLFFKLDALRRATIHGEVDYISKMLAQNIQWLEVHLNSEGDRLFQIAVKSNQAEVVKWGIQQGYMTANEFSKDESSAHQSVSPLILASLHHANEVISELLKILDLNTNVIDSNTGNTALMILLEEEEVDIAMDLLEITNINLTIKNKNHESALSIAARKGYEVLIGKMLNLLGRTYVQQEFASEQHFIIFQALHIADKKGHILAASQLAKFYLPLLIQKLENLSRDETSTTFSLFFRRMKLLPTTKEQLEAAKALQKIIQENFTQPSSIENLKFHQAALNANSELGTIYKYVQIKPEFFYSLKGTEHGNKR